MGNCVKEQQIISAEVGNLGYSLVDIEREGRGVASCHDRKPRL